LPHPASAFKTVSTTVQKSFWFSEIFNLRQ
jgi:hypothetical protein